MADVLGIDLETFSTLDIKKVGAYKYTEQPEFEIMLFGYAWNEEPIQIIDLASGEEIPQDVLDALLNPEILKTAYNAAFERICLSHHFHRELIFEYPYEIPFSFMRPEQWQCTAVHALTMGLPGNLEQVAKVLNFPADKQKMAEGKALIKYFCTPCKPAKTNGMRTRNLPHHAPEKWELFKSYCCRDVGVERDVRKMLSRFPMPASEMKLWYLDQRINDRGVRVDTELVRHAIACDEQHKARTMEEAVKLTGLDNPNSGSQLKNWLFDEDCIVADSLTKDTVPELLKQTESDTVKRVLELRQELSKTSVKKYQAMDNAVCADDRVRGLLQFYGANRTGRWAGRLVQVQNLPQNHMADLDLARQLLREGYYEMIEVLFGNVQNVLSQLIRTAFIPDSEHRFLVADFSAIEARVIAWLAGEQWRIDVFNTHGKIYEASASQMFKIPIESITKGSPERQKGKVAELALGYQGGPKAMEAMGALKQGLTEDELPEIVAVWRRANPAIVRLWKDAETAALSAVKNQCRVELYKGVAFHCEGGALFAGLPSGRRLAYVRPKIEAAGRYQKESITYEGMDQTTKQWTRVSTYGGKLVENLVQAIARDCLAHAMMNVEQAGYGIVMHVHDEAVIEYEGASENDITVALDLACEIMGQPIPWAPGLPLRADGFETTFYKKDD